MAAAPVVYEAALGVHGVTLPHDPIQDEPDYASALAAFEALPQVRILFDNGAGSSVPGNPVPGFEQSFAKWPVPGTKARSLFLDGGGALASKRPAKGGKDKFSASPTARPPTDFTGDTGRRPERPLDRDPAVRLDPEPGRDGRELRDLAAGREHDRARRRRAAGLGALLGQAGRPAGDRLRGPARRQGDLRPERLAARRPEQARPGEEHQARAGAEPAKARQAGPLSATKWTKVTVPLYYQGHAYRAGSPIRVTVSAVGGDQPVWAFAEAKPTGSAKVTIAHSPEMPSKLLLPVVDGVDVPTGLPPCPGLRGEPCRDYVPYANRSSRAALVAGARGSRTACAPAGPGAACVAPSGRRPSKMICR